MGAMRSRVQPHPEQRAFVAIAPSALPPRRARRDLALRRPGGVDRADVDAQGVVGAARQRVPPASLTDSRAIGPVEQALTLVAPAPALLDVLRVERERVIPAAALAVRPSRVAGANRDRRVAEPHPLALRAPAPVMLPRIARDVVDDVVNVAGAAIVSVGRGGHRAFRPGVAGEEQTGALPAVLPAVLAGGVRVVGQGVIAARGGVGATGGTNP